MTTIINRRKKGISTVLTTLIIVVASVVLGTAVTLFGTSLFQTGASQQSIDVTGQNLWINTDVNGDGTADDPLVVGSVAVRNTGDKLIAIDKISVRGALVPFTQWYASNPDPAVTTPQHVQSQFLYDDELEAYDPVARTPASISIPTAAGNLNLGIQNGPVSLDPGKSTIIYFVVPGDFTGVVDVITSADVGAAATLKVNAGQLTSVQSVTVAKV
ncbi:MAG: hypothetical protein QXU32_00210 [Nitrososphaerales archaeon]